MLTVVVVATWAASCLHYAHTLELWMDPRGYYHYVLTKECFGEEVALQQEKEAMQHGEYCVQQSQGKEPSEPLEQNGVDLDTDFNGINLPRAKRSMVKLPRRPSLEVILCNLRQFKLLTDDNRVNFTAAEERLQAMKIDPRLKSDLLQSATACRPSLPTPSPVSGNGPSNSSRAALVSAVLAVTRYQGCFASRSLSICKEFACGQVASKLRL